MMGTFLLLITIMSIKVLITALGQQIIADVKQVENSETNELLAYWLREPRLISYVPNEAQDGVSVRFGSTCAVAVTTVSSARADHVVSILDHRESGLVEDRRRAFPTLEETTESDVVVETEEEAAE